MHRLSDAVAVVFDLAGDYYRIWAHGADHNMLGGNFRALD